MMINFIYSRSGLLITALLISIVMLLNGCLMTAKSYVKDDYDIELVHKIAVLPFENLTMKKYSDEKMKEQVIIELLRAGYEVVEEGEVSRLLADLKIRNIALLTLDDIRSLGEELGTEVVVRGSVSHMGVVKGVSVDYPEVTINLRMIDVQSGDTVWSVSHSGGGPSFWTRHFGTEGKTLDEVAEKVVKEAVNTLK